MCHAVTNRFRIPATHWNLELRDALEVGDVAVVHRSLPEYRPTPLLECPALARRLGVGQVAIKDESHRFGLNAFKALGAAYAIARLMSRAMSEALGRRIRPEDCFGQSSAVAANRYTFSTATDGNHGRGVAWAARKLRQRAVIYVPAVTVPARIAAIESEGARVVVVDADYDGTVARAARDARQNHWQLVSDTSWTGYTEVPRWIMAGYTTIFDEIEAQSDSVFAPDFLFVQGGVGALPAAAAWWYNRDGQTRPTTLISVEPAEAACLLESIRSIDGQPATACGTGKTIMAGLNCGTPSTVAWPLIRAGYDLFLAVSDAWSIRAMRRQHFPQDNDPRITAGESGAAGLAGLIALAESPALADTRRAIGMNRKSRILLLNTEGDTDPESFRRLVASSSDEL